LTLTIKRRRGWEGGGDRVKKPDSVKKKVKVPTGEKKGGNFRESKRYFKNGQTKEKSMLRRGRKTIRTAE